MKKLNEVKLKKTIIALAAGISVLAGSVAVYAAEEQKLQPVAQEVVDASVEIAQAQAAQVAEVIQEKAEEELQLKLEKEARKAERKARKEAEKARKAHRQEIVDYALQFVGNPYVYGGTSLTNGADCSGFVQSVFGDFGYSLPRVAGDQAYSGTSKSMEDIEPGDLVFYGYGSSITHVAIYIGDGQIVHASTAATGIKVSDYDYQQPCLVATYLL